MNRSDSVCSLSIEPSDEILSNLSTNIDTNSTKTVVTEEEVPSSSIPKKADSKGNNKCNMCIKKLITSKCKCGIIFCMKHLNTHTCTFDYRKEHSDKLTADNPVVIAEKLTRI